MNNPRSVGLSVLLCLYLAFGLMGFTPWVEEAAQCETDLGIKIGTGPCGPQDGEPVAVYMVAVHSASMHQWTWDTYTAYETRKQCEKVALPHERCIALLGYMPR
jgi:hypothetical protein